MMEKQKDYFISRMFRRLLLPSLLSSLGFALADMVDAIVLGQRMGEVGLAAISLCLPLFMLINAVMDGLGIGGCVCFSQKLGEGKAAEAVECFNRIVFLTALLGVGMGVLSNLFLPQLLAVLGTAPGDGALYKACGDYAGIIMAGSPVLMLNVILSGFLRNDNHERLASMGFFIGNTTDFLLNIFLVLVLDCGTAGAAASTVAGSAVAIFIYLCGILGKRHILRFQRVKMDLSQMFSCWKTGFSTSVQHLFRLTFFLLVNRILMDFSAESGVAIFNMVYSASFLILYLFNGTAEAAQPLISTFAGESSEEDVGVVRRLSIRWGLLVGGAATVLVFLFAGRVCGVFGLTGALLEPGAKALRIFCTGAEFAGINILLGSYYQAREEAFPAFLITALRSFFVLIPCMLLLVWLDVEQIWWMYPVTELLTFLIFWLGRRSFTAKRKRLAPERLLRLTIHREEQVAQALEDVSAFCRRWRADAGQGFFVTMAVEEITMAIFQKAMGVSAGGRVRVTLIARESGDFELHFIDNAVKFDPFSLKSTRVKDIFEELDVNAMGMTVIREKAEEFLYRQCQGFNSLMVRIGRQEVEG